MEITPKCPTILSSRSLTSVDFNKYYLFDLWTLNSLYSSTMLRRSLNVCNVMLCNVVD